MALSCSTPMHSSNLFLHSAEEKTYTADMSQLSRGGRISAFGRIYDDACDEGLKIQSERSLQEATFVLRDEETDADHDVTVWTLVPEPATLRRLPKLAGYKVIIFND